MKIISFTTDPQLIRHILEHLAAGSESLWLGEASGYRSLPGARPAKKSPIKMARQSMNPVELLRTTSWIPQGEPFKPALNLIQ